MTARALGIPDGGALLARPDGVPAASGRGSADAAADLRAAVDAFTGRTAVAV